MENKTQTAGKTVQVSSPENNEQKHEHEFVWCNKEEGRVVCWTCARVYELNDEGDKFILVRDWRQNSKNTWTNSKETIVLNIYYSQPKYEVGIRRSKRSSFYIKEFFTTKSEALNFAEEYMRKN